MLQLILVHFTDGFLGHFDHRRHARFCIVAIGVSRVVLLDVLGDVDQDRPGTVTAGMNESQANRRRDTGHTIDQVGPLGDGLDDGDNVNFLESIFPQQLGRHIAGDCDNRRGVAVGVGDTGHQVGGAGTRGCQADAHLSAGPGVTLCGMSSALFMLDPYTTDAVVAQDVEDLEVGPAGITKYDVYAFQPQAFGQDFSAT